MLRFLIDYTGRIHPLVVHFPIALLIVGAGIEGLRIFKESSMLGRYEAWIAIIGATSAVVAATTGWLFAYQAHQPFELHAIFAWHRWLGIGTAIISVISAIGAYSWKETPSQMFRWLRRCIVWAAAVFLTVAAHLGALLVWGTDYFS